MQRTLRQEATRPGRRERDCDAISSEEERDGSGNDAFRDQLIHLGGAPIQNGLYVSPHPWEKAARGQAERLGVLEHTTFATTDDLEVGGTTDPRRLASLLWPLDDLGRRYQAFVDRYEFVPALLEQRRREKQGDRQERQWPRHVDLAAVGGETCAGPGVLVLLSC